MPLKNAELTIRYMAWDMANNVGKTGDAGNHTLTVDTDGTEAGATNSPAELSGGQYKLTLTADEMNGAFIAMYGESSTEDVVIIPVSIATYVATATAANQLAIKAQTDRIGSVAVQVTSPVAEDGTVEVVEGDDYQGSQALSWTFEDWAGPAMTSGAAVELLIMTTAAYDGGTGTAAETVAGDYSVNGTTVTITAELTSAQTAALGPTPPADAFAYTYQIRCTASGGEIFTPAIGAMTVMRRVDPAS